MDADALRLEHEAAPSRARAKQPVPSPGRDDRAFTPRVDSIEGVLALQRAAGNTAVQAILGPARRHAIQRQVGWSNVDPKSWNAGARDVRDAPRDKGVKRIPVEGITRGHASGPVDKRHPDAPRQDDAREMVDDPETGKWQRVSELTPEAAGGVTTGRAIVMIPNALPEKADSVDVLFHLHGYTPGGRGRGKDGTGDPEDVAVARIGQQLEASARPMIAILPQGTRGAGFWPDPNTFDLNKYIDETLGLVPAELWPDKRKRDPGGVVLSAHSGGGDVLANLMAGKRVPGEKAGARAVEGLLLFDALHGWGPDAVAQLLTGRLAGELVQLHGIWAAKNASAAPEAVADEQTAWLRQSGFRFRGFASAKGYLPRYEKELKPQLASWFTRHAAQLGGTDSCVFRTLRANYLDQAAVPAGTSHEQILGGTAAAGKRDHQHLLEALGQLQGAKPPELGDCERVPARPAARAPARTGGAR